MIRTMLIAWAALASIVMLVAGVVLAVWRFGALLPGALLALLAAGLLYTTWHLAREEWGWRRRLRVARQAAAAAVATRGHLVPSGRRLAPHRAHRPPHQGAAHSMR